MQTEPDVLTDHNELILSTSIERIVTGRDSALMQIQQIIEQLDAISRLTSEIGGGTAQDWAMKAGHRYDSWMTEKVDKALPAITRNIDRSIWRDLMLKSGMMALMDAQARDQWHKNLEEGDLPAISEANILSTFEQLHLNKMDVFERGIINVFKRLSWDYRGDVTTRLMEHIRDNPSKDVYEDAFFSIRYFQKGTAHLTFKRPELTERMNDIIAKHYPGMLAQR